ncbi:MAG: hypothetical protein M3Y56_12920, partial [Armatimonadota bacterium]|nr:hypothetical protein [Armatimonadota bacterium]
MPTTNPASLTPDFHASPIQGGITERFNRLKPEIMRRWEESVRREVPSADKENRIVLRDGLPILLDELAERFP